MFAQEKPGTLTVWYAVREIAFGVGFALLLPLFFGLDGVLYSMPVSDALTFLLTLLLACFVLRQLRRERE